tara:strand:+ start:6347 stop:6805 length:459 start_codon:yes stop_codon:yes gene_type:complete
MPIILQPIEFANLLTKEKLSVLGIDYGSKNLGLAIASSPTYVTTPLDILRRKTLKKDFQALQELQKEVSFQTVLIGLPLNMDGSEGPMAQATKQFGFYLKDYCGWPVCFWDERLSSVEALERTQPKKHDRIDHFAAHIILESYLQRHLSNNQ